jgi:hypothetical protein
VRSGSQGSGSGVIWTSQGVVITNAHVIRGSSPVVELWDGVFSSTIAGAIWPRCRSIPAVFQPRRTAIPRHCVRVNW